MVLYLDKQCSIRLTFNYNLCREGLLYFFPSMNQKSKKAIPAARFPFAYRDLSDQVIQWNQTFFVPMTGGNYGRMAKSSKKFVFR
jgi:hypothetical protein